MLGVINIPFLDYDTRRQVQGSQGLSYASSFMMGVFFSAGWAPCVGPVLGAVLTIALNNARIVEGVVLLTAYSFGLAIPFLIAALAVGSLAEVMKRYHRAAKYISYATGVILLIVGALLFFGALEQLARFGFFVDFGL
jgi:cytochrome c-type biogenesis protein